MTYKAIVEEVIKNSDLTKLGVTYRVQREDDLFVLYLDPGNFDTLPVANRLIASTEVIKVLKLIAASGIRVTLRKEL